LPRDREQPGAQRPAPGEPREVAGRLDEDLLVHVIGERRLAQRAATVAIDRVPVAPHQAAQRRVRSSDVDEVNDVAVGILGVRRIGVRAGARLGDLLGDCPGDPSGDCPGDLELPEDGFRGRCREAAPFQVRATRPETT